MNNINFKSLSIQNYKSLENVKFSFKTPDGTLGSGLNTIIGENGSGKTAVLDMIYYLSMSKNQIEEGIDVKSFNDKSKNIVVESKTTNFLAKSFIDLDTEKTFSANGLRFEVGINKVTSPIMPNITSMCSVVPDDSLAASNDIKIDLADKMLNFSYMQENKINLAYFDKNRDMDSIKAKYKGVIERIRDYLEDTLSQDISNPLSKDQKNEHNFIENIIKLAVQSTGTISNTSKADELFNSKEFMQIKEELKEIIQKNKAGQQAKYICGYGINFIFTLIVLEKICLDSDTDIVYIIDEPELHMHPRAQNILSNLLLLLSKKRQVFVATHSSFIFNNIRKSGLILLDYNDKGSVIVKNPYSEKESSLMPWSPSLGELIYKSFKVANIEFFNEMYGRMQTIFFDAKAEIIHAKQKFPYKNLDEYLESFGCKIDQPWIRNDRANHPLVYLTLETRVRHSIHHPEAIDYEYSEGKTSEKDPTLNELYTYADLKQVTKNFIEILEKINSGDTHMPQIEKQDKYESQY